MDSTLLLKVAKDVLGDNVLAVTATTALLQPRSSGRLDAAEEFIRGVGLEGQVRMFHFGDTARIEVDDREIQKLTADTLRSRVVHYFKELGFRCIMLDLEGYRVGSLNRVINEER